MIKTDEDALICDFAETYHIYDWRKLPIRFAAILASGLPDDSRIKRKINGQNASMKTQLMALILDGVNWLVWSKTKDAERGRNAPDSYFEVIMGTSKKHGTIGFTSAEEFEAARAKIIGG